MGACAVNNRNSMKAERLVHGSMKAERLVHGEAPFTSGCIFESRGGGVDVFKGMLKGGGRV